MLTQRILTFSIVFSIFINYELLLAMNIAQQRPWEPIDVIGANVIDIDNPNGHWQTGDPNRGWIDSKFNIWGHVRSKYEYRAPHLQNGRMVFIVIHGSLPAPEAGPFNPSYYKSDDRKDQNFRHIMRFAASLAQAAGKELDLLSFQWSGLIDETARKVASMLLTQYIEAHYAQETAIVILSHSHGCNIANLVSHQLSWPISLLIHFANPVRSNNAPMPDGNWVEDLKFIIKHPIYSSYSASETCNDATPDKFEVLMYFYSTSDLIATLGGVKKMNFITWWTNTMAIYNGANFMREKIPLDGAQSIINGLETSAHLSNTWTCADLAIKGLKGAYIHATQNNKIIVGIRTQIDNKDPDHGSVVNIVRELPNIYARINNNYMLHFLNSSLFDLHINMQQANDIHMAIRQVVNPNVIPANQLANQLLGQYNLQQIVQLGQQETQFSNQQAQAYRNRYNRDINNVPRDQHKLLSAIESKCSVM